jgi:hypothetical protein
LAERVPRDLKVAKETQERPDRRAEREPLALLVPRVLELPVLLALKVERETLVQRGLRVVQVDKGTLGQQGRLG